MKQLIDKSEVLNLMDLRYWGIEKNPLKVYEEVRREINYMPSIEAERPKGNWIKVNSVRGGHECDLCREYALCRRNGEEKLSNYCPYCGADMRGEE